MGNVPMLGGSAALEEIDKNLKSNRKIIVSGVFPADTIFTSIISAAPAVCMGVLLFFSTAAFGEASLTCVPTESSINRRNDFEFIKSICWARLTDYPFNQTTGKTINTETTDLTFMSQYPCILFIMGMFGIGLKFMWTGLTGNISKEVDFVRHGIEEASAVLISELKPGKRKSIRNNAVQDSENYTRFHTKHSSVYLDRADRDKFKMFEHYLETRSHRHSFVFKIIILRLICVGVCTGSAYWLYREFLGDITSPDGRDLTREFNCLLPVEYIWKSDNGSYTHETIRCFFKGRSTRVILTMLLFCTQVSIGVIWIVKTFFDLKKWKKDTTLLRYFQFHIESCCVSNLDVIMALVHVNAKDATTVAMRTLAGLKNEEKDEFLSYFEEFVHWQATDEGVEEISKIGKSD